MKKHLLLRIIISLFSFHSHLMLSAKGALCGFRDDILIRRERSLLIKIKKIIKHVF